MPKTTKDVEEKSINKNRKTSTKITKTIEKVAKKVTEKKNATKNNNKNEKVKAATKKAVTKTATKVAKKSSTKPLEKTTTKKSSSTRTTKNAKNISKKDFLEYYDLPYRYNQTVVKILAQTPRILFVYWDISDDDRLQYKNKYGDDFFTKTRPVLIVHNETKNYSFEVEINDFANSWYLQVSDANCKYFIELGRRANIDKTNTESNYFYITSSNEMDAPNDHILFEQFKPMVKYKNIKNGKETVKNFANLSNFKGMQNIYGIYNFYKEIYKNELFDEIIEGNTTMPSSRIK